MKTKAAVAVAARKPLEIITVDLDGPRAGEVLVEIKASGVCHTDEFTRSGADPEGLFPAILGDLITHRMPLTDINKAFDLMHSGESIRSVVVYS
jgi:Zn-dependent alcohol dehydrogenase